MSTRVFIGRLSHRASERDVEDFFRGYGRIRDIVLKNGFGFVEFESSRDADDAIYDLNGKELGGERVTLEFSKRTRDDRHDDRRGGGYGGGSRGFGGDRGRPRGGDRYGPPVQTRHRIVVENLSTRISWQDLKDIMRKAGCDVTYADAHKRANEAVVCFQTRGDLERAMDKLQGEELNGRKIKLTDDSKDRSRSRSKGRRSRSRSRSRSHSASRSKSRSKSRSRSASRGKENGKERDSRSPSKDRSPSASPKKEDRSRSGSPADD